MSMGFIKQAGKIFKLLRFNTVKKKLIWYSFFIVLIMCTFNIYSFFYIKNISREYNNILNDLYMYNRISTNFNSLNESLDFMLSVSSNNSKEAYVKNTLLNTINDAKGIEEKQNYTGNWVLAASLRGLLQTYSGYADRAFILFNDGSGYINELSECRMISKFINKKLNEIINNQLNQSSELYAQIEQRNRDMQLNIVFALLLLIILNAVVVLIFSNNIARPIKSLSRKAERIASGDLDVDEVIVRSNDEISILANSFNKMSNNIRTLIRQIVEKADVEKKLKEEEMKNLQVSNALRETELKVLQSQINPHFLFNTLNTIARMSMLENAETTLKLIESTSELLRYNLGKIKQGTVTLRDEIENVKEYVFIQQIRFSDRITFEFDIDESVLDIPVPYLLLQPLVENAIIHGIEPMEEKGRLTLSVLREKNRVLIEVKDNGIGIDPDKLDGVFENGNSARIGLQNVKKRLEYYFNEDNLINIRSNKGQGTVVTIRIPAKSEEGDNKNV